MASPAHSKPHGEELPKATSRTMSPSFETRAAHAPQDEVLRIPHRAAQDDFRWDRVAMMPYKEDDRALFKTITRQVLFTDPNMAGELRYFEVAPGGYSTLERHEHMHGVLILRGSGHCLVGDEVKSLGTNDLVTIAPMTWHQFRATKGEPLGFLCMVNAERDKPQLPTPDDVARLRNNPAIAAFLDDKPTS
jgi:mannose-6-phosphate isomerase-like protein (cupin superfamily)